MSKTTIRESKNKVNIEGYVKKISFEEKEIAGKNAISGEVDIQTTHPQTKEEYVHTINAFAFEKKNDGTPNTIFKSLQTVRDTYKSIDADGIENADKVRVTTGQYGRNEFWNQSGQLSSYPRVSSPFFNRVEANDNKFEEKATFDLEVFVIGTKDETKDQEPTGRLILKGYVLGRQADNTKPEQKIYPVEFIVDDPKAIKYVESNYEKGKTINVFGDLVNSKKEVTKVIEADFGDDQIETTVTTVREMVIKGGVAPYGDDKAFDPKEIKALVEARDAALEAKKNQGSNGGTGGFGSGGGNKAKVDDNPFGDSDMPTSNKGRGKGNFEDIDDDSLPF